MGGRVTPLAAGPLGSLASAPLTDHKPFFYKLSFGESRQIVQNDNVSLTAFGDQTGGNDRIRIIAATSVDGALLKSDEDNKLGPGQAGAPGFLNADTPESEREFVEETDTSGQTSAFFQLDGGYVVGPDGSMISIEEEGLLLAINYLGANCVVAGIADSLP